MLVINNCYSTHHFILNLAGFAQIEENKQYTSTRPELCSLTADSEVKAAKNVPSGLGARERQRGKRREILLRRAGTQAEQHYT